MFKSNEQNQTDIRILSNFIEKRLIKEGADVCTYQEMRTALGGRDIQNGSRHVLDRARKDVEKRARVFIGTVTTVGIKIVDDLQGAADKSINHIRRTAKTTTSRLLNAADEDKMTSEQTKGFFARLSALGALSVFAKKSAIKRIEGKLTEAGIKELPTAETLRLFEK